MGVMLVRSLWTVTGSTSTGGHIRIIAGHPQSKKNDHLMPWRFRKHRANMDRVAAERLLLAA
jgi:hypothetical protein